MQIETFDLKSQLTLDPQYQSMLNHINKHSLEIYENSQIFGKAASQFKNVTLDVTELTDFGSIKHILAVIEQTRWALEDAHFNTKKKDIEYRRKMQQLETAEGFDKELIEVELAEMEVKKKNSEFTIKAAIRKMSFFVTQYEAIMAKMKKSELTEMEYELSESRHHIMTALKQALCAARAHGGIIDEGNHIYLFELGINGGIVQQEIFGLLEMENKMLSLNETPTHEMVIRWMNMLTDRFIDNGINFAHQRGFVTLDEKSLTMGDSNE